MRRFIFLSLFVVLLLSACTAEQAGETISAPLEQGPTSQPTTAAQPVTATQTDVATSTAPVHEAPTAAASLTVVPTEAAAEATAETTPDEPTATLAVTETPALQIISGQTAEGAYFYGDPGAPVTLIDYSDFL